MSIAPVTGIKVPVSFMGNVDSNEEKMDPAKKVSDLNDKIKTTADSFQTTCQTVSEEGTQTLAAVTTAATPFIAAKAAVGKFAKNLFKTIEKDANGVPEVIKDATDPEVWKKIVNDEGKVIKQKLEELSPEDAKQVAYKMKTSKVKVGVAIAAAVAVVGAVIKSLSDKKKAEAAEAPAETPEAAPEVDTSAEAVEETEETPEEE